MKKVFLILLSMTIILKLQAQQLFPENNNGFVEYKNIIEAHAS